MSVPRTQKYTGYPTVAHIDIAKAELPALLTAIAHGARHHQAGPFAAWNVGLQQVLRNCYTLAARAFYPTFPEILAHLPQNETHLCFTVYLPNPGATGGKPFEAYTPDSLSAAVERDGFKKLATVPLKNILIPPGFDLIAGYIKPATRTEAAGYHFYTYHKNSMTWFGKDRLRGYVSARDGKGRLVRDVTRADRWGYDLFVGYFLSPPDRMPLNIIVEDEEGRVLFGHAPLRRVQKTTTNVTGPQPRMQAA